MIIGIYGKKRSGKDTIANFLCEKYGESTYFLKLQKWIKSEYVFIENEIVYLSKKGKYISDNICSDLFKVD